jgi:PAS domain S-box-containing protein
MREVSDMNRETILNRITHVFLTVSDEEMYGEVLDIVLQVTDSRFGIFGYITEEGDLALPSLTKDIWDMCHVSDKSVVFASDTWGDSLWGRALREKKSFISDGPFKTPEGHIHVDHFLTVPIVFGKEAIGLISVANKEEGYSEGDRELLEGIANHISPILNARLQRDIKEKERRQAEEALQKSEREKSAILDAMSEIVIYLDTDMKVVWSNSATNRQFNLQAGQIAGRHCYEALHGLNKTCRICPAVRTLETGEPSIVNEFSSLGKRWTMRAYPVRDEEQNLAGIVEIVTDITERKLAEEALRKSEATLLSVFKATPVGICIMKDRVYRSANKAWCENFGYTESDLIGNTTRMLYENVEEYERVGRELYENLSKLGLASIQTRLRRKDGSFRDSVVTAALLQPEDPSLGTVVAIQDVTDYRRTVEELKENRRQLSDIIEFLPDATFVIDKEGKVVAWNRAIETVTGVRKEDIIGRGNYEYALPFYGDRRPILIDFALHPDREMERQYTAIQRVGDILFGEAFTPNLPPGDVHLSATASVLRDDKGEIIAAIECIRDNTERKKLEERLKRAEKMESLGTLAGGVAHDLNNVLGVLVGYSELLYEKLPGDSPLKGYANSILQSGVRGAAIIQDLLTLARRGVTVSEVVDLNRVVFHYLRTPEFEKLKSYYPDVKIWTDLEEGLLNIKGSPVHLGKTIMNLISNAAEAISGRGEVTIRTENRYLDKPILGYDEMQEGDYVVLTVSDTGSGIPAGELSRIFEPFYTKKVMGRSGTGLGLAVVWGTVKDHNGYIDVRSEEGKGSTFTLYFPATREAFAKVQDAVSTEAYMGKGESILIVDDVEAQREVAKSMLGRLGYQVEAVASGEKAIEYLKSKKAELIVLDMVMDPGIDGMETYRRILEVNPGQKAIVVSGFSETERVRSVQEMGAGDFVRKPYLLERIGLAIRKELDRK